MKTAIAYYRTSSATNVGDDKDSLKRQRDAVCQYAEANGYSIAGERYDAAVRGTDAVTERPGFKSLLSLLDDNPEIGTIFVETASRFARDVVVQITGYELLKARGVQIVPVDCPYHFEEDTPTAKLIRTVLGAVSAFEKDMLVDKLKKARNRKRSETGRCEGRKPPPLDHRLAARGFAAEGASLRAVGARLASQGILGPSGMPYGPESIKRMIAKS